MDSNARVNKLVLCRTIESLSLLKVEGENTCWVPVIGDYAKNYFLAVSISSVKKEMQLLAE